MIWVGCTGQRCNEKGFRVDGGIEEGCVGGEVEQVTHCWDGGVCESHGALNIILHWMLEDHQKDSTGIREKQVHNIAWGLLNSANNTCIKLPFFEIRAMKCKVLHIKSSDKPIIKSLSCEKNKKQKIGVTKNDQISEWEADNIFDQTKGMNNQFSPKIAGFKLFSPWNCRNFKNDLWYWKSSTIKAFCDIRSLSYTNLDRSISSYYLMSSQIFNFRDILEFH